MTKIDQEKQTPDKFVRASSCIESSGVEDVDDFTCCQGFKKIINQSVQPIFGSLFHPSYMLINSIILGQIQCDPSTGCHSAKTYLAAFGLGSSLMSILLLASGLCYTLGLNNMLPQTYASKNYTLCGAYLNRMIITATCIFVPFLVPLQFVEYLFLGLMKQDAVVA